eukprot:CFRG8660
MEFTSEKTPTSFTLRIGQLIRYNILWRFRKYPSFSSTDSVSLLSLSFHDLNSWETRSCNSTSTASILKRRVWFTEEVTIADTYSSRDYDRTGYKMSILTMQEFKELQTEMISFKLNEMKVHKKSRCNVHMYSKKKFK